MGLIDGCPLPQISRLQNSTILLTPATTMEIEARGGVIPSLGFLKKTLQILIIVP